MNARRSNRKQPLLLVTRSPLSERLGDEFFRALPDGPGVYFFHDAAGTLLYIGQSGCLKHRLGSYRHVDPDRHPRRSLRLISRVARIEWRVCETAAEAIALEAALLREHRPPFNRAGVWPSAVWWLRIERAEGRLQLRLSQTPEESETEVGLWRGPLTAGFRHAFPALARCLYRALHPEAGIQDFPVGLFHPRPYLSASWAVGGQHFSVLDEFEKFIEGEAPEFLEKLSAGIIEGSPQWSFWEEQLEQVRELTKPKKHYLRQTPAVAP